MDTGKNKKNLLILGAILAAGVLYYVFVVAPANSVTASVDPSMSADLQAKTARFIEHRQTLEILNVDVSVANELMLLGLKSYSAPVPEQVVGKSNIFDEPVTATELR
jgi:hypothetical protein